MLKQLQTEEILRLTRTGIWQVEMEQGGRPRFYANDIMDEMLGVKTPLTPEERYEFHQSRIHPDDRGIFQEYVNEMKYSNTERPSLKFAKIGFSMIWPPSAPAFCGFAIRPRIPAN